MKNAKKADSVFSKEEQAAARETVRERRAHAHGAKVDGETEVRTAIAKLQGSERAMAERLHTLIKASAPTLSPRTWYGMPAYSKDDEVLCWFQPASKFKARYGTLGFSDGSKLDEGRIWPVAYAITELTATEEAKIAALVKRAVG